MPYVTSQQSEIPELFNGKKHANIKTGNNLFTYLQINPSSNSEKITLNVGYNFIDNV